MSGSRIEKVIVAQRTDGVAVSAPLDLWESTGARGYIAGAKRTLLTVVFTDAEDCTLAAAKMTAALNGAILAPRPEKTPAAPKLLSPAAPASRPVEEPA